MAERSNTAQSRLRLIAWSLVMVAAIAATIGIAFQRNNPGLGGELGGGQYVLADQRGNPVDQSIFTGHPSLLFFGYTHCPDVCPTTMAEMANWFETLGPDAGDLRAFFVTVDPERDTPEVLGDYVSWVSDRITGLTGDRAQIDKVIAAWHVVAQKVPSSDGSYTMNHTASIFLLDAKGQFVGTIAYQEDSTTALAKIRRLVTAG